MRILHIFNTHEDMRYFARYNVDHCHNWKGKECTIESPSGKIMFRVVASMQDCMNIAGYEVSCVIWHYTPSEDVRKFVQSRIRYLK